MGKRISNKNLKEPDRSLTFVFEDEETRKKYFPVSSTGVVFFSLGFLDGTNRDLAQRDAKIVAKAAEVTVSFPRIPVTVVDEVRNGLIPRSVIGRISPTGGTGGREFPFWLYWAEFDSLSSHALKKLFVGPCDPSRPGGGGYAPRNPGLHPEIQGAPEGSGSARLKVELIGTGTVLQKARLVLSPPEHDRFDEQARYYLEGFNGSKSTIKPSRRHEFSRAGHEFSRTGDGTLELELALPDPDQDTDADRKLLKSLLHPKDHSKGHALLPLLIDFSGPFTPGDAPIGRRIIDKNECFDARVQTVLPKTTDTSFYAMVEAAANDSSIWVQITGAPDEQITVFVDGLKGPNHPAIENMAEKIKLEVVEVGASSALTGGKVEPAQPADGTSFSYSTTYDHKDMNIRVTVDIRWNISFRHRFSLDLGSGSHQMACLCPEESEVVTPLILNIANRCTASYTAPTEAPALLYDRRDQHGSTHSLNALGCPFANEAIRNRFPSGHSPLADLTVVCGGDEDWLARLGPGLDDRRVDGFKSALFQGAASIDWPDLAAPVLDVFAEVCRVRFIEAMMSFEKDVIKKAIRPPSPVQRPPAQFIVTHPAYVDPERYVEMLHRLAEVHGKLAFGEQGKYNRLSQVCTIPEPVALARYLDAKEGKEAGSDCMTMLDFGATTLDVAIRRRFLDGDLTKTLLIHASAAELGGRVLDAAIGGAIGEVLGKTLPAPGQAQLADRCDLSSHAIARALRQPGQGRHRADVKRRALQRIEDAKIEAANDWSDGNPTFRFELARVQQNGLSPNPDDDWIPPALCEASRLVRQQNGWHVAEISWRDLENQPSLQSYLTRLKVFLQGIPEPPNTAQPDEIQRWCLAGRAALFKPISDAVQDEARRRNQEFSVPFEHDTAKNKEAVASGAILVAAELGTLIRETGIQACLFHLDLTGDKTRIVAVHDLQGATDGQPIGVVAPATAICVARCSLPVAEYVRQHHGNDPEVARPFFLGDVLARPARLNPGTRELVFSRGPAQTFLSGAVQTEYFHAAQHDGATEFGTLTFSLVRFGGLHTDSGAGTTAS